MDQQTQESSQEQVTASKHLSHQKEKEEKRADHFSCSPADCRCRRRRLLLYGTPEACLHSQIIPGACAHYEF